MAAKPTPDIILSSEEIDESDSHDENYHTIIEAEKQTKKELKPGQKAVVVRRRIEDYLESKWMREYYGVEPEEIA